MAADFDLKDVDLTDLRAYLAHREAQAASDAAPTPAQQFCAELVDHRISGPALAVVFGKVFAALDQLGVDVFAEPAADQPAAPADPATPVPTDPPADGSGKKGSKS